MLKEILENSLIRDSYEVQLKNDLGTIIQLHIEIKNSFLK